MEQTTNAATQLRIKELLWKTQEKEEERKKKKQEMQASKDVERQHKKEEGQDFNWNKTAPEASSSQMAARIEKESKEIMTGWLDEGPQSTAQQVEDTSQKTITVRSKAGRTITLEWIDELNGPIT